LPVRNAQTSTRLDTLIADFVAHQRTFGRGYLHQEYILRALGRFVSRRGAGDLSASLFDQWSDDQRHLSPTTLHARQLLVRKLCLFRRRRDRECFVPDHTRFARPRPYAAPVIVTSTQILTMLRAASQLPPSERNPLRPAMMRVAVVLLYTAGLRRGELLRLQLGDVDADGGVLRIRESKFHRSRWVPLSKDARRELRQYLRKRLRKPYGLQPSAPLLFNGGRAYGHTGWHAFCGGGLGQALRSLFRQAHVHDAQGRHPRVHDLRHSFAVESLVRWYRQGGDVQTYLPKLALYMGHVSIVSTAYYLHFIPEIATLASERFGRRFSYLIDSGVL
jgi:integrase/recombinase XerD